ncbi:MAG: PhzF family phenazine biosynthesis protein [Chloroflexi bacterium]|uniref:PhzF family phenazine biosynthesis protein n=1 Tax=Candidatus Chlorohelix allophototropha TaxID=3003348 RepID=A0A8T7LTB4_9CHLR|nr:PhzF family phenazine biosynthesis protein [Chloroflexota bacterium]WJW67130.1 PhzF family phenazine biosynthesis protein [Chloroflexota bacterium L227-S17]
MAQRIVQVDAFTDKSFSGNPAAVCVLVAPRDNEWMQNVAREMNLSETAFLLPESDGYRLRWFTPALEVELCGHATLASAHVLWQEGYLKPQEQARFYTLSGLLTANLKGEWIELNFPLEPAVPVVSPPDFATILGATPLFIGQNRMDYIVELESEEAVRLLKPDMPALARIETRGVIVTARASKNYDFVSRFFAPASGVNEDPVTGSAHCCLAPYWQAKLSKSEFIAYQASARGGVVQAIVDGDRTRLLGKAITVLRGELDC